MTSDRIIIIGGGLAGLVCALKLNPLPVTLLSHGPLGHCSSSAWAQGGIAAAMGPNDSHQLHAEDTYRAGCGIVDDAVAQSVAKEAAAGIEDLRNWGVPFDTDENGRLSLGREAAHSVNRIVRAHGDSAGAAIVGCLVRQVRSRESVEVLDEVAAAELLIVEGNAVGIICHRMGSTQAIYLKSRAIVLAAGGLGGLYRVTTNPRSVNGQALGMAARAGATISNPEFVQFHPTAIAVQSDPVPLATEALRGAGAILVDDHGVPFMASAHPAADLAPRDIVTRAIYAQAKLGRRVYLDTRRAIGDRITRDFPTVAKLCHDHNIDPQTAPIPVVPAAHYHMGGVKVDISGRSSIGRLWACGEIAHTGLHGANRLASNSLLEAIVYAKRVAQDILGCCLFEKPERAGALDFPVPAPTTPLPLDQLRTAMTRWVGIERDRTGLPRALRTIVKFSRNASSWRDINVAAAATLVAAAAFERTESRGAHFRTDYANQDEHWARPTEITLASALATADAAAS